MPSREHLLDPPPMPPKNFTGPRSVAAGGAEKPPKQRNPGERKEKPEGMTNITWAAELKHLEVVTSDQRVRALKANARNVAQDEEEAKARGQAAGGVGGLTARRRRVG
jgi:uncharacterized linocin/CFP29 family protein